MGDVRHKFPFPVRAATRNGWSYAHLYKNKNVLFALEHTADRALRALRSCRAPAQAPSTKQPKAELLTHKRRHIPFFSPSYYASSSLTGHKQRRNALISAFNLSPYRRSLVAKEEVFTTCYRSDLGTEAWLNSPSFTVQTHQLLDWEVRIVYSLFVLVIFFPLAEPTEWETCLHLQQKDVSHHPYTLSSGPHLVRISTGHHL